MCLYVGSYTGQILEYDNEIEHLGSDVKCLASELGDRLCLEFVSSDGDADDDGDDDDVDDENNANLPLQVLFLDDICFLMLYTI